MLFYLGQWHQWVNNVGSSDEHFILILLFHTINNWQL